MNKSIESQFKKMEKLLEEHKMDKSLESQLKNIEKLLEEQKQAFYNIKQQRKSYLIEAIDKFAIVDEKLVNKTNEDFENINKIYLLDLTKLTEPVSFQGTKQFITIENDSICMLQDHYFELVINGESTSEQRQLGFVKYMMCVLGAQYTGSKIIEEDDGSVYKVYTAKSVPDNKGVQFSFSGKPDGSHLYFYQL